MVPGRLSSAILQVRRTLIVLVYTHARAFLFPNRHAALVRVYTHIRNMLITHACNIKIRVFYNIAHT